MKNFAVIGLGRFGSSVAKTIHEVGGQLLIIDSDEQKVNQYVDLATNALIADAQDERVLDEVGIAEFDAVVVAIGENIQSSALITMLCKDKGVSHVVTKAVNPTHAKLLTKIGADRVVLPEIEIGDRVAKELVFDKLHNVINIAEEISFAQLVVNNPRYIGMRLATHPLFVGNKINISYVKHVNGLGEVGTGETQLGLGDEVFVVGEAKALQLLSEDL